MSIHQPLESVNRYCQYYKHDPNQLFCSFCLRHRTEEQLRTQPSLHLSTLGNVCLSNGIPGLYSRRELGFSLRLNVVNDIDARYLPLRPNLDVPSTTTPTTTGYCPLVCDAPTQTRYSIHINNDVGEYFRVESFEVDGKLVQLPSSATGTLRNEVIISTYRVASTNTAAAPLEFVAPDPHWFTIRLERYESVSDSDQDAEEEKEKGQEVVSPLRLFSLLSPPPPRLFRRISVGKAVVFHVNFKCFQSIEEVTRDNQRAILMKAGLDRLVANLVDQTNQMEQLQQSLVSTRAQLECIFDQHPVATRILGGRAALIESAKARPEMRIRRMQ